MRKFFVLCSAILLSVGVLALRGSAQQDKGQRPSPPAQAVFHFADGKTVTVDYSSPRAKGRKIFGGLVPYGQVWRAGANEATTITADTVVTVGGKSVPAGTYTLFTIPNADKWTLIISKTTKNDKGGPLWGTNYAGDGGKFHDCFGQGRERDFAADGLGDDAGFCGDFGGEVAAGFRSATTFAAETQSTQRMSDN